MYCKYSNIFGEPNQGIHSIRIFDIAIIDVLLTIIAAYIVSNIFNISFIIILLLLFILGIIFHRLFCVKTTIDKLLNKIFKI
jgi:uncharacterized membrane protein YcaP (DUF421 family)